MSLLRQELLCHSARSGHLPLLDPHHVSHPHAAWRSPRTPRSAAPPHLSETRIAGGRPQSSLVLGHQCAAESGVSDGGRPPATGLQEQVANHRKRRGSKARVVSVTEKAPRGVRWETGRRTPVNCRSSVESTQMTSKPAGDVTPGSVWTIPAYGPDGVRHRGSAILFQALTLNCGNLRWRWQAKGTSPQGEADSSDAPPRGGTARSVRWAAPRSGGFKSLQRSDEERCIQKRG